MVTTGPDRDRSMSWCGWKRGGNLGCRSWILPDPLSEGAISNSSPRLSRSGWWGGSCQGTEILLSSVVKAPQPANRLDTETMKVSTSTPRGLGRLPRGGVGSPGDPVQPCLYLRYPFKLTSTSQNHPPIAFLRLPSQPPKAADIEPAPSPSGNQCSITGADGGSLSLTCERTGPLVVPGRDLVVIRALLKAPFWLSSGLPQAHITFVITG